MINRASNLITLDLVKKLRKVKNVSMKNYSYDAQKVFVDEINKQTITLTLNGEINKVNGETNKTIYDDFLFIHKYGLELWLKS